MKKLELRNIIREEIQILLEGLPKKGDFVESPYIGRKLKDGSVAPKFGVIKSISRGMVYIDYGVGTIYTTSQISDMVNTNKKEKGKDIWKDEF